MQLPPLDGLNWPLIRTLAERLASAAPTNQLTSIAEKNIPAPDSPHRMLAVYLLGFTAAERKQVRRFRCHLELRRDLTDAARSERLQDTLDYRVVCALVVELGTQKTFRLLEALAGAIVTGIRERYPGVGVTVTLEKLAPPCAGTLLLVAKSWAVLNDQICLPSAADTANS